MLYQGDQGGLAGSAKMLIKSYKLQGAIHPTALKRAFVSYEYNPVALYN
jgi:hypothetical protein